MTYLYSPPPLGDAGVTLDAWTSAAWTDEAPPRSARLNAAGDGGCADGINKAAQQADLTELSHPPTFYDTYLKVATAPRLLLETSKAS